ncbi:AraC family transcriptional regulator [Mycolicibacterium sp. S2-37]|nr:AraC family transcriptional regulator [Mycolicibacterium sp. S2-37]
MLMALLRPKAVQPKMISGAGEWSVGKPPYTEPSFCLMLEGSCVLDAEGLDAIELGQGDFLLLPTTPGFTLASGRGVEPEPVPLDYSRDTHHGCASGAVTMRMLGGFFRFDRDTAPLLVSLLPRFVLIRRGEPGVTRLQAIVELIAGEADGSEPCRDLVLERLVEVLMIEAIRLRAAPVSAAERGLLAGLSDPILAPALRQLHADVAAGWTVQRLARSAGVSRAVFAERFTRTIGMPPGQYLMQWRMALAQDILRTEEPSMTEVARRVGYQSAGAFITAFSRLTGRSPSAFARSHAPAHDEAPSG